MDMIARACLTVGVGTLGTALVWVIRRLRDLELEVAHMKRAGILEHKFTRRQIREIAVMLKAHLNEITIRKMVIANTKSDTLSSKEN